MVSQITSRPCPGLPCHSQLASLVPLVWHGQPQPERAMGSRILRATNRLARRKRASCCRSAQAMKSSRARRASLIRCMPGPSRLGGLSGRRPRRSHQPVRDAELNGAFGDRPWAVVGVPRWRGVQRSSTVGEIRGSLREGGGGKTPRGVSITAAISQSGQ